MAYVRGACLNSVRNTDESSVGLKVTSLKWVGPEPESIPQIPAQIEYKDTVPRIADIGFEDEGSKLISPQPRGTIASLIFLLPEDSNPV
jgi:hypothetical protein